MNTSPQIEPTSTSGLLKCLAYAIDETKLLRSIERSTAIFRQLQVENPASDRLLFLKKEISNLEARLVKIRGQATSMSPRNRLKKYR